MYYLLKYNGWKWFTVILLIYSTIGGFLFDVPRLPILNESIRSLHFHVPMWFGMIFLFTMSVFYSIKYLKTKDLVFDIYSRELIIMGVIFGVLGIITGMVWATYTWGEPWSNDPKQNASAITMLIYFALLLLRASITDEHQRARLSNVYSIFAFSLMVPLLFILPRLTDSLHPGNGGNPGFNAYDLDSNLRKVFYTSVLGWALLGFWIATIRIRISIIKHNILYA